jgi:hypothetical protein
VVVRNRLLSNGESFSVQGMLSPSYMQEVASSSAVYDRLSYESATSLPFSTSLILENIVTDSAVMASPSENVGSVSVQVQRTLKEVQSNNILQEISLVAGDEQTTSIIASNDLPVPAIKNPEASILDSTALIADITPGNTDKPISQRVSIALNTQTVPIVKNKPVVPIVNNKPGAPIPTNKPVTINSRPTIPTINNPVASAVNIKPVASVIHNKPVAPVQINASVVSGTPNKPTAPVVNNRPVAPVVDNKPVAPVVNNKPVVSVVNNKPVVPVVNNKPVVPVVNNKPVVPVVNNKPVVPVVNNKPVAPIVNNNPATATQANKPAPSVGIAKPIAPVVQQRPVPSSINAVKPVAPVIHSVPVPAPVPASPPSVTQTVHLIANAEAEKQVKSCYRTGKKITFSQYWIPRQNEWDETNDGERIFLGGDVLRRMDDRNGKELGWAPVEMYNKCQMEGTVKADL